MRRTFRIGASVTIASLVVAAVVAGALFAARISAMAPGFGAGSLRDQVESAGPAGPLVFLGLLAAAVIIAPIPNTPFFVVAGVIWGPVAGSAYAMAGLLAGSLGAFLLARLIPRRVVAAMVGRRAWGQIARASEAASPWAVFWARLLPAMNFDWINYLAGLTPIEALPFALATAAGTGPATILTVAAGSAIEDNLPLSVALTAAWVVAAGISALVVSRRRSARHGRLF
jgi:uncharacterized membrane protein YdjX (TVP38/TMEM64 family)